MRHVLMQLRQRAPAIAVRVLDLLADLPDRFSFPRHLDRRELPARVARYALVARTSADQREVVLGVTGGAGYAGDAEAVLAAQDRRHVRMLVVALQRPVGSRMAVHAARIGDDL